MKIYTVFEIDGNDEPVYERFFTSKELRDKYIKWLITVGVSKKGIHKGYIKTDIATPKEYCIFTASRNYYGDNKIEINPYPYSGGKYYIERLNKVERFTVSKFSVSGEEKYSVKRVLIKAKTLQRAKEKVEKLLA